MKRYHECALVKDGNKRVGYFIIDTNCTYLKDAMSVPWRYVDSFQFEELVKSDQVQYLVYDNGSIKCKYTDEERAILTKLLGSRSNFIQESETNYFSMDCTFTAKHVELASKGYPVVACCVGEITSLLGVKLVMLYFYGSQQNLNSIYGDICSAIPNFRNLIKCNGTVMRLFVPVSVAESLFNTTTVKPLFCTSTIRFMLGIKPNKPKKGLFKSTPDDEYINNVIELFNKLTTKFLKNYV